MANFEEMWTLWSLDKSTTFFLYATHTINSLQFLIETILHKTSYISNEKVEIP